MLRVTTDGYGVKYIESSPVGSLLMGSFHHPVSLLGYWLDLWESQLPVELGDFYNMSSVLHVQSV